MSDTTLFQAFDLHDDESDAIDVIKADLAAAEKQGNESAVRSLRDKLSEARIKRIGRLSSETWDILERLAGRRLRR